MLKGKKFNGDSDMWNEWKEKVEAYLVHKKWGFIAGVGKNIKAQLAPNEKGLVEEAEFESYYLIISLVEDRIAKEIKLNIAEDGRQGSIVLKWMDNRYGKSSAISKAQCLEEICNTKMKEDGVLREHVNSLLNLIAKYNSSGSKLDDETASILLLFTLSDKYTNYKRERYAKGKLHLNEISEELIQISKFEGNLPTRSEENALTTSSNRARNYGRNFKDDTKCFRCGREGHIRKNCMVPLIELSEERRANEIAWLKSNGIYEEPNVQAKKRNVKKNNGSQQVHVTTLQVDDDDDMEEGSFMTFIDDSL